MHRELATISVDRQHDQTPRGGLFTVLRKESRRIQPRAIVAWLVLAAAALHPPHGLGVDLCLFKATSGVPCPGCGLTRSVSCAVRGMFASSWNYHPFGIPALLGLAALALSDFVQRRMLKPHVSPPYCRAATMRVAYALLIAAFLAFGVLRALQSILN